MQILQQFKSDRRQAVISYNPPVTQRRDVTWDSSTGLSSLFQVCLADTQARALVDPQWPVTIMARSSGTYCTQLPSLVEIVKHISTFNFP